MGVISVVIPAHNEEKYILPTLQSVLKSSDPNFEAIIVSNGCTDNTHKLAQTVKDPRVRAVSISQASVSKARNEGAKQAKGSTLVFLDADTHVSHNALEIIRQKTDDSMIGTLKIFPDAPNPIGKTMFFFKNLILKYAPFYPTSNGIIFTTKNVYDEIGGFREDLRKREDGVFIRTGRKSKKFQIFTSAHVITSMRRYEQKGYLNLAWFWLKDWFLMIAGKSKQEYEVVR